MRIKVDLGLFNSQIVMEVGYVRCKDMKEYIEYIDTMLNEIFAEKFHDTIGWDFLDEDKDDLCCKIFDVSIDDVDDMRFDKVLDGLSNGKSFEEICKEYNAYCVECCGNEAFYDDDLVELLEEIGVKVEGLNDGYALVSTANGKLYDVPYREIENRFDNTLPCELILWFNIDKMIDVSNEY